MKNFEIGPGLTCNLDRLVDTRLLVQANSGGGKSWCLRRILEQTHGQVQHLVIDPEGEFASLRERFDYVLAARAGGDTVADPRSAKLLAERLLELKVSAILDIYELKPHERIRFVRYFLEALVNAPKALWHPALVVVDEAHVYCPQTGEAESADAVKDLATRGRKRGFCAVLATQRLSKLHKDAAAECNNKLIGRTSLDVDMKRAGDELGFVTREQLSQLRVLVPGAFFAFGPAIINEAQPTVQSVNWVQVGRVETTHPKAGARIAFEAPPATSKIKALLPKLSDLPQEAADRERSIADLKAELANTKRELTLARKEHPAPKAETKTVEKFVLKDGQIARAEQLVARIKAEADRHLDASEKHVEMQTQLDEVAHALAQAILSTRNTHATMMTQRVVDPRQAPGMSTHVRRAVPAVTASRPAHVVSHDGALPPGEHATLTAALQYPGLDRKRLGILTGYKRSSRDAYIARLVGKGLIEVMANALHPTEAGHAAMNGSFEPLPTGAALVDYWRQRLPEGERKVLDVLLADGPELQREHIDQMTGYKRSSRDAYLTRLKARGLVDFTGRGTVKATDELFG